MQSDLGKSDLMTFLFKFYLLNVHNLHTQVCALTKYQLYNYAEHFWNYTPTKQQYQKDQLYNKHWENTLQVLTKTAIIFEYNAVKTRNLYYRVCYELTNGLLGKFLFYYHSPSQIKVKISEKKLIMHNRSNIM